MPRARLTGEDGKTRECAERVRCAPTSAALRAADALIAGAYLAGTNTRRVRRALNAVFAGLRSARTWSAASGARRRGELGRPGMRVRSRRRADCAADPRRHSRACPARQKRRPRSALLVALGVRADGQKMLLVIKSMGGKARRPGVRCSTISSGADCERRSWSSSTARRASKKAVAALWPDMAVQRCTVHKHRNLLAHAPERLHEEISNDYRDMIYAATRGEVETRRKAFIRKWRLKCRAVADSLEEAERRGCSHSRGSRRANGNRSEPRTRSSDCTRSSGAGSTTQTVLPCARNRRHAVPGRCSASGQITMRKVDGWQTLAEKPDDQIIDLAA